MDADLSPPERSRAEIRARFAVLAGCIQHEDVEAAGWTPSGEWNADHASWCAVYDLVVARRAVTWLREAPGHVGAPGWHRAVERFRDHQRRSA